jgi:hypothetical protein
MRFDETIRLRGDLCVRLRRIRDGKTRRIVVRNTITYRGIDTPTYLWAPDGLTLTDYDFRTLAIGSNATPPTHGDLGLLAQFNTIAINSAPQRVRSPGQVEVRASVPNSMSLGQTIREFGILLGNGNLFARQTVPDILLNGVYAVDVSWRFGVTAT